MRLTTRRLPGRSRFPVSLRPISYSQAHLVSYSLCKHCTIRFSAARVEATGAVYSLNCLWA